MADEADEALRTEESYLRQSMAHCKRPESTAQATGWCNHCGKSVDKLVRWCSADCRDEWESDNECK